MNTTYLKILKELRQNKQGMYGSEFQTVNHSTGYSTLTRMAELKLVKYELVRAETQFEMDRRRYYITVKGQQEFNNFFMQFFDMRSILYHAGPKFEKELELFNAT